MLVIRIILITYSIAKVTLYNQSLMHASHAIPQKALPLLEHHYPHPVLSSSSSSSLVLSFEQNPPESVCHGQCQNASPNLSRATAVRHVHVSIHGALASNPGVI